MPSWSWRQRRRRRQRRDGRCGGCGWWPPDPVTGRVYDRRHDPRFTGHAPSCPTRFDWIVSEEHLHDMRLVLMLWAAEQERASSDPEWLLLGEAADWRAALDTWQLGLTNVAVARRWERP